MAVLDRKMFMGGLDPKEYQDLLELSRSFGDTPTVNQNVTAADVIRATGPLGQPVAEGAVNTVAQFNQFLAGILGNKFARIDEEKQAVKDAENIAQQRVDTFIAAQADKNPFIEVNDQLIDTRTLGGEAEDVVKYDFRDAPKKTYDNIKVVNNKVFDLDTNTVLKDLGDADPNTRFIQYGDFILDTDALKQDPDDVLGALVNVKQAPSPTNAARVGQLVKLKEAYEEDNEEFPADLQAELDYLQKEDPRPYVSPSEEKFVDLKFEKQAGAEAAESQYSLILEAERLFADPNFVTGTGTAGLLPVQKFFVDLLGINLDDILEGINIDILNDPGDTETLNRLTNRLAINILGTGKLPGPISDFEFRQMINSVFNATSTEEANLRFIQGMKYLYNKEIAQAEIAGKIDSRDENALNIYRENIRAWDQENRPKYLPDNDYIDELLENMPEDFS